MTLLHGNRMSVVSWFVEEGVLEKLFRSERSEAPFRAAAPPLSASIPDGLRLYVVGDIHGRADLMGQLRDMVDADLAGFAEPVATVFLGDYVDRGSSSRQVLEMLLARDWPTPVVALRGNHEQAFLSFVSDPGNWDEWQAYGALPTLASFGVDVAALMTRGPSAEILARAHEQLLQCLAPDMIAFMRQLTDCTAAGDYFFCHAGVRPGVPLQLQASSDLLTIREPFLSSEQPFGKVVVHGHTPQEAPCIRTNRIGIDTGAYATGCLTALILERDTRAYLCTGRGDKGRRPCP